MKTLDSTPIHSQLFDQALVTTDHPVDRADPIDKLRESVRGDDQLQVADAAGLVQAPHPLVEQLLVDHQLGLGAVDVRLGEAELASEGLQTSSGRLHPGLLLLNLAL